MQIKAVSLGALAVSCLLTTERVNASVLWKGDFETGDVSQWDGSIALKTGARDNLVFETDTVADGTKAAKITLRDDIIFEPYNQSRVEVKHVGLHTLEGEDSYYAWSFMLPKDAEIRSNIGYWESTPTSKNTMTFFIEPAQGGGTNIKFGTGDLGQTVRWTAKLELNEWHRMAIHNHWSEDAAVGKVDVWYDGTQVVVGASAAKRDANKLFFQMGLHRSDPSPPVQDIYIDAAIEADSQADILAPLPDPSGGGGGGGGAGMSGAGSVAGGGSGGSNSSGGAGSGGELVSSAGGPSGASAGLDAGGTGVMTAGAGGASTLAGDGPVANVPNGAGPQAPGSCAVSSPGRGRLADAWPLLAFAVYARRRRRGSPSLSRAAR
jgi:hypothetical protein